MRAQHKTGHFPLSEIYLR